jgi:fatty acid-binding protein DegV
MTCRLFYISNYKNNEKRYVMKRKVGIVVDSTFGLDKAYAKKHNISVVTLKVIIDGKEYVDGSFNPDLVVDALHQKLSLSTSQPTPEQFMDAYKHQLESFESVLCLTLSKTLSGTNNSANLALTILENDQVKVIDTESTICGASYMTEKLVEFLDEGKSLDEAVEFIENLKDQGSLLFTVDNLQSLVKSGRIGKVQAVIGNYLKNQVQEVIGKGKVIVRIAYVDRQTEAKELEHEIFSLSNEIDIKITGVISPVVSAHVGLGGLGIYLGFE